MNEGNSTQEAPQKDFADRLREFVDALRPYIKRLWPHRYKILKINLLADVIILLYLLFLTKPYYKTTITILPEYGTKASLGGLGGLASLAGINLAEGTSTVIYQNILSSESVLSPVVYAHYLTKEFKDSVNLIQYFEVEVEKRDEPDVQERRQFLKVYNLMKNAIIQTDLDRMTEILDITVTMPESKLSAEVANNIVESLDEYVQTVRKSNAIDRRLYLERRNSQIEDSLRNNEEALKTFQIQNKIIEQSPELVLQQSRLMRNVELYQATNIQINQQLEIARIDEIKDNPIINLKEKAKDPVVRSGPPRRNYFIFLIILVGISATSYFVYRDQLKEYFNIVKTELKK
jgi:uncharacterized protein involved in exopolysaccharide biosynthesis